MIKHNIQQALTSLVNNNKLRQRHIIQARSHNKVKINHRYLINFTSNDYLGLAQDNRVQAAFIQGVKEFGFGSCSSALLSGHSKLHHELEENFADLIGRERALFFNSGYHANLGVITTFADRHTAVIADKHCHASLIDAITLSRAQHYRYQHNNTKHAHELLRQHTDRTTLLITESVFSMTGAITPIKHFSHIANSNHATLIVDDAHGFGILGQYGCGASEHFHLTPDAIPILITPFGKAIAGMGAMVSGSKEMIELLMQKARTYCYSTALPPALCVAALQSLEVMRVEPWRLIRLRALSEFFNQEAFKRKLLLISVDHTPIKCIAIGSNHRALLLQNKLMEHGLLAAAIRPPTVPENTARIRITINYGHTEQHLTQLLDVIATHYHHDSAH